MTTFFEAEQNEIANFKQKITELKTYAFRVDNGEALDKVEEYSRAIQVYDEQFAELMNEMTFDEIQMDKLIADLKEEEKNNA